MEWIGTSHLTCLNLFCVKCEPIDLCVMDNKNTSNFLNQVYALDLSEYLRSLNIVSISDDGHRAVFPSPFGKEPHHFLSIDKVENRFYDSALQKGGNLIDFGMLYHQCSLPDFLEQIKTRFPLKSEARDTPLVAPEQEPVTVFGMEKGITAPHLLQYLEALRIPPAIANAHCHQVSYDYYGENFEGIGFRNDAGGYAIIIPQGKLMSEPQDISTKKGTSGKVDVYQDFTDYLNTIKTRDSVLKQDNSTVILHDFSLFEKARPHLEKFDQVNLYFHNSAEGRLHTQYAQWLDDKKYKDFSKLYAKHDSITAMAIDKNRAERERLKNRHNL